MNAEFNWWLLIVGLVLGAALTWLVMAESARRDADITESEQRGEALWIASMLSSTGRPTEGPRVEEILRLHREYLAAPPPDEPRVTPTPAEGPDAFVTPEPWDSVVAMPEPQRPTEPAEPTEPSEPDEPRGTP